MLLYTLVYHLMITWPNKYCIYNFFLWIFAFWQGNKYIRRLHTYIFLSDPIRRSRVEGFSTDSVTVPPVMKILDARSLLNCASRCVQDSKCLIFAYNRHRGNGRCGLTDADDLASGNTGPPPGDWSGNGISWFVVDAWEPVRSLSGLKQPLPRPNNVV